MSNDIHPKVKAATAASLAVSVLMAVLVGVQSQPELLGGAPRWLQAVLVAVIPPALVFLAGYQTPGDDTRPGA